MASASWKNSSFPTREKPRVPRHSSKHLNFLRYLLGLSPYLLLVYLFQSPGRHNEFTSVALEIQRESYVSSELPAADPSAAEASLPIQLPPADEESSSPDLGVREKLLLSLVIFIVAFLSGGAPAFLRFRLGQQQQPECSMQSLARGANPRSPCTACRSPHPSRSIIQCCTKIPRSGCSLCSTCQSSPSREGCTSAQSALGSREVQETRAACVLANLVRLCQAVTAGVVTAVGVLHLLPDADKQLQSVLSVERHSAGADGDAWGEAALAKGAFVCCLGGLFLSSALEVVFCDGHHQHGELPKTSTEALSMERVERTQRFSGQRHLPCTATATAVPTVSAEGTSPLRLFPGTDRGSLSPKYRSEGCVESLESQEPASVAEAPLYRASGGTSQEEPLCCREMRCPYTLLDDAEQQQRGVLIAATGSNCSSSRGLVGGLLVAGLSGHSVVEGISMAAAPKPQFVAVAILAHKAVESFAVGNALIHGGSKGVRFVLHLSLYASTTPLGVLFGLLLQRLAEPAVSATLNSTSTVSLLPRLLPGIMTGLGAGAFMHLGIVDLLGGELAAASAAKSHRKTRQRRAEVIGAAALGALIMALIP